MRASRPARSSAPSQPGTSASSAPAACSASAERGSTPGSRAWRTTGSANRMRSNPRKEGAVSQSTTLDMRGIDLHPNGRSRRVRVHPFRDVSGFGLDDAGLLEALAYRNELRELKRQGILVAPPRRPTSAPTLAE